VSRLSLRLRVTLAFAVAMALVLAATGLFLDLRLRSMLDEQLDEALQARGLDAAGAEADDSVAQLVGADGSVVRGTPSRPLLDGAELARARTAELEVERDRLPGFDDERVRLLARPVDGGVLVAGVALGDRDEAVAALRTQLLVAGPLALLLASLAGYGLATAALRPVEAMRRGADEISAETSGRRLPVPAAADEVARLARTLNRMLDRLDAGIERERRFVADASHELRTPLALLRAELDVALRRPRDAEELRAALTAAAADTERLVRLANDLLVLATAGDDELPLVREAAPARELLDAVAARFEPVAASAGRRLEVAADNGLVVHTDRLRLEQALGNLVDNALRHGAGVVRVTAEADGDGVVVRVSDEGPGLPPPFVPHAFERFSRADDARAGGGAGLGLALVDAVVRAHGGTATVDGSVFSLRVPSGV
jgi:signal transduction histidine kinase